MGESVRYRYDIYLQDLEGKETLWTSAYNLDALQLMTELMKAVRIDAEMWTLVPADQNLFSGSGRIARIEILPDRRATQREEIEAIQELLKPMGD